jgi:hypothetical protein
MGILDYAYYLLEQSKRELIYKKPPIHIKSILNQIKLFEVYPKIFAVVIKDDRLRSRVFLRYQEFYESDSDSFRGKSFKWEDYIKFYKEKTKKDYFSYHEDYAGYNIPCDTIEACKAKIPDLNIYDMIMFSVTDTIKNLVGDSPYYLIGIDQDTGGDQSLIFHEVAHGLWFSDPNYKKKMTKAIEEMDPKVKEKMLDKIKSYGYGDNVYMDELQAYMSTGLGAEMKWIRNIKPAMVPFNDIFMKYASKINPKQIPIDWSTDLDR